MRTPLRIGIVAYAKDGRGFRYMGRMFGNRGLWEIGGVLAGIILIAFGAVSIWMGVSGVNTVRDNLAREKITGSGETSLAGYTVPEG
jgi:hypothetical protein